MIPLILVLVSSVTVISWHHQSNCIRILKYMPTIEPSLRLCPKSGMINSKHRYRLKWTHFDSNTKRMSTATNIRPDDDSSTSLTDGLYDFGQYRCLFVNPKKMETTMHYPPMILLGGTAQSIDSWQIHIPSFSKDRSILIFECATGKPTYDHNIHQLNVTLPRQAELVHQAIVHFFSSSSSFKACSGKVDIVGFSLGGRIAMAYVILFPSMVRKVHLTGVAAKRDEYARIILQSWLDILQPHTEKQDQEVDNTTSISLLEHLRKGQLRSLAWSILINTYSDEYLSKQGLDRIQQKWIPAIMESNSVQGLFALLQQTREVELDPTRILEQNEEEEDDEGFLWHPTIMAQRIASLLSTQYTFIDIRLHVGELDKLASVYQVQRLHSILKQGKDSKDIIIYKKCGHAVWLENAHLWRNDLLDFLNS